MEADPSDDELMRRAGNGDRIAFAALVRRHLPRVGAVASRMLPNRADAEEVGQEAFLRCWQKAPGWLSSGISADTAQFSTWLQSIVINLCIDRRRRVAPMPLAKAPDPPDPSPDTLARMTAAETARQVRAAVDGLPDRQRAVLVLCYYENMSNAEAAAILDLSVGAVESLLVRARRRLRSTLSPGGGGRHEG